MARTDARSFFMDRNPSLTVRSQLTKPQFSRRLSSIPGERMDVSVRDSANSCGACVQISDANTIVLVCLVSDQNVKKGPSRMQDNVPDIQGVLKGLSSSGAAPKISFKEGSRRLQDR